MYKLPTESGRLNLPVKRADEIIYMHKLPLDFKKGISASKKAKLTWDDITPLARNEWICWVTSPKKSETRERRIRIGIDKLSKGDRRPCCWPGCPHR